MILKTRTPYFDSKLFNKFECLSSLDINETASIAISAIEAVDVSHETLSGVSPTRSFEL